jgi:hypothetical protein
LKSEQALIRHGKLSDLTFSTLQNGEEELINRGTMKLFPLLLKEHLQVDVFVTLENLEMLMNEFCITTKSKKKLHGLQRLIRCLAF